MFDIDRQPCFFEGPVVAVTLGVRVISSNTVEQRKKGRFTLENPSKTIEMLSPLTSVS